MYRFTNIILLLGLLLLLPASYALTSKISLSADCEPLTTLNINGKIVKRLLIDTGGNDGLHLKETVIKGLPGNPAKFIRYDNYTDVFDKKRTVKFFIAPQLTINGVNMYDVPMHTFSPWGNLEERLKTVTIQGVIGLNSFGDNALLFDLQNMILKVAPSFELDNKSNWEQIPIIRTDYGVELLAIGDAGKRLRLVLDTGSNKSVLFGKPTKKIPPSITEVVAGNKQVIKVMRNMLEAPELSSNGIDGFVGCDFIKGKRLIIAKEYIYITNN